MTRWLKRCGIGAATLFLIYVIGGFVGVPLILKHVILAKVDKQIVGSLETGSVRFNPFTWVLEVKDFKGLTSEGETATSFAKFRINLQPTTIFAHEKVVHEILLDQPKGLVRINPDGDLKVLADARAQATFAALTGAGIDKGRVQVDASSDADSPRVEMSLEILD